MTQILIALAVFAGAFVVTRMLRAPAPPPRRARAAPPPAPRADEPVDLASVLARVAAHRRVAYLPVVEEGDGGAAASKLGGAPALAPGEAWPACGNCGLPMQLFVQLAGGELPTAAQGRIRPGELLQFFYCTRSDPHCESECEAYSPHAKSTLLRIVSASGVAAAPPVPPGMFPPRRIVGWTEKDDYPHYDELGDLGVQLAEPELDALADAFPRVGDKLLGWPAWVQSVEYPACRICGERLEPLFQLDSEHNLPYMFGDVGIGHVTQCPSHQRELAFGWACH